MELQTHGAKKYPTSALLRSSAGLGWSTISAELRAHGVSESPVVVPQHVELCLAVAGTNNGLVRRSGAGQRQEFTPTTGAICLAPIGVGDNTTTITAPIPQTMHLYLPTTLFRRLSDDFNLPGAPAHSIRYAAGIQDEMIDQIVLSILSEMTNESAVGRMYVETASLMLAARLVYKYCDSGSIRPLIRSRHGLDERRLRRVLAYVEEHLAEDITVADLADVACLSLFHFTRVFAASLGVAPHRYVSQRRLESAKAMIATGRASLSEIALESRFSSQSSFTRAFRRATGMTPTEYRRTLR